MKKLFLTAMVLCALSSLQASQPNTVQVEPNGVVSRGASKLSTRNYDINQNNYNRKPTRAEISDQDPRQMNDNSKSWNR